MDIESVEDRETGPRDIYGFPLPSSKGQGAARQHCEQSQERQGSKWAAYAKRGELPGASELKKLCRKGIPPQYRRRVWPVISGAARLRMANGEGYYNAMVQQGQGSSNFVAQIDLDLPRTFPQNEWTRGDDCRGSLRRVLLAFSMHAHTIGYCQGMNFLAAMLLLVLSADEEETFWVLLALLDEGILYPESFSHNLLGCHVEMGVLSELVRSKLPVLGAHFARIHVDMSIIATDYYLCLFCTVMPAETAMRIWDSLLLEGPKVLHRVALTLLKENQSALLALEDAGLVLQHMKKAAAEAHNRDALMQEAFQGLGSMPMGKIQDMRKKKHFILGAEFRKRESKRSLRQAIQQGTSLMHVSRAGLISEAEKIKQEYSSGAL